MEFIRLTGYTTNKEVFIKATVINGIIQKHGLTKVFVSNDLVPYEVKESAEEVINLIEITNKG